MVGVHRRIVQLASLGFSADEISKETGVPVAAVRLVLKSPLAQGEVVRLGGAA